jgi:hypothetical protein
MSAWIATVLTCWCCVLIAIPHRPRRDDEAQELAYRHLIGRYHWLLIGATAMTVPLALALGFQAVTGGAS